MATGNVPNKETMNIEGFSNYRCYQKGMAIKNRDPKEALQKQQTPMVDMWNEEELG
jgi:hypothetical protein